MPKMCSQHGSTEGNDKILLHNIANIKGCKLACININSLYRHIDEICFILMSTPLEVLAIYESKLDDTISDGEICIPGYVIVQKDRSRHGGGVALYTKESLSHSVRADLVPSRLEMLCVEINLLHSSSILVSTWYRSPSVDIDLFDDYIRFVEKCDHTKKQLIILGEMNCDYSKSPHESHTRKQQFLSTRVTNTSASLIDLIFTNETKNIAKSGVIHNGMSDHSLIAELSTELENHSSILIYIQALKF